MAQPHTKVVSYLREIRALIDAGIKNGDIPADFQFGASMSSNNVTSHLFLRDAMTQGRIFTYIRPEMVYQDVGTGSGFEKNYNNWKAAFPATILDIRPVIYNQWSALKNACIAKGYSGYNHYSCYNQGWFKQVDWAHKNNVGIYIYTVWVPSINSGYFPQDKYPGSNATQKIAGILSSPQDPSVTLPPIVTPTPILTPTPTTTDTPLLSSGSMSVYSNPPQASIIVNNKPMGVTNRTGANKINMPATPFYVQIVKDGYKTITDFGVIAPGKNVQKTYNLQPANQKNWFQAWVDGLLGI